MTDLAFRIRDYLKQSGYTNVHSRRLNVSDKKEGIIVRPLPLTQTHRYFDGSFRADDLVSVMVKSFSEEEAATTCQSIVDTLSGAHIASNNGSYVMEPTGLEVYSFPQELELTDEKMFIYEARLSAPITKGR